MKKLLYVGLLLGLAGCSESKKETIIISPLEVTNKKEGESLKLDDQGVVFLNGKEIAKIIENNIVDLDGEIVFTLSDNYIVYDKNNDTVEDYNDKRVFLSEGIFVGKGFKWTKLGFLENVEDSILLEGVRIVPNDSNLYRTASLMMLFIDRQKE